MNNPGKLDESPLHKCVRVDDVDGCRALVAAGAEPLAKDGDGFNAIHVAASFAGEAMMEYLLSLEGADLTEATEEGNGLPPLHLAVLQERSGEYIDFLIRKGAAVDQFSIESQRTALHEAADRGLTEGARALLRNQAAVNNGDIVGLRPLALAAGGDHAEVAALLLAHGARWQIQNADGDDAFVIASRKGSAGVVALFLEAGADPDQYHPLIGMTPREIAQENGHDDILSVFRSWDARKRLVTVMSPLAKVAQ